MGSKGLWPFAGGALLVHPIALRNDTGQLGLARPDWYVHRRRRGSARGRVVGHGPRRRVGACRQGERTGAVGGVAGGSCRGGIGRGRGARLPAVRSDAQMLAIVSAKPSSKKAKSFVDHKRSHGKGSFET